MNPSVAGGNHASVYLERQVVRWLTDLVGLAAPPGQLASGGSAATITCLAVARQWAAPRRRLGRRAEGLQPAAALPAVRPPATSSVTKAAELIGLGTAALREVPVDEDLRMDPVALPRAVAADRRAGNRPSPSQPPRALPTPAPWTRWTPSRTCAPSTACGCTWTAPTVRRRAAGPATARDGLARADNRPRPAQVALRPGRRLAGLFRDAEWRRDTFSLVPPTCAPAGTSTSREDPPCFADTASSRPARSGR